MNVWKLPTEEKISEQGPDLVLNAQGHSYNSVTSLSIDNTGLLLASGCLKGPSVVVNIWSLIDGSLLYTTKGSGGVNSNGMLWLNVNNLLSIAFSRSKSICLLSYGYDDLKKNLPLAAVRTALIKKGIYILVQYKVRQSCMVFLKFCHTHLGGLRVFQMVDIYSSKYAISLAIKPWSVAHRMFTYNTFIETDRSGDQCSQ